MQFVWYHRISYPPLSNIIWYADSYIWSSSQACDVTDWSLDIWVSYCTVLPWRNVGGWPNSPALPKIIDVGHLSAISFTNISCTYGIRFCVCWCYKNLAPFSVIHRSSGSYPTAGPGGCIEQLQRSACVRFNAMLYKNNYRVGTRVLHLIQVISVLSAHSIFV